MGQDGTVASNAMPRRGRLMNKAMERASGALRGIEDVPKCYFVLLAVSSVFYGISAHLISSALDVRFDGLLAGAIGAGLSLSLIVIASERDLGIRAHVIPVIPFIALLVVVFLCAVFCVVDDFWSWLLSV